MRTIELDSATAPLAEYASTLHEEPLVVTRNGRPVAVLRRIVESDLESLSLSTDKRFLALVERSRARQDAEGGILSDEMRRRLGLPRRAPRPR